MRELRRRIKNRFDELGIEIPYPHRTVYWRTGKDDEWVRHFAGMHAGLRDGAPADGGQTPSQIARSK
jgi:small conductance mechanosensitive channel